MKPDPEVNKRKGKRWRLARASVWSLLGGLLGVLWGFAGVAWVLFQVIGPALDQGGMVVLITTPVGAVAGAITGGCAAAREWPGLCGGIAALLATPVSAVMVLKAGRLRLPGLGPFSWLALPLFVGLLVWCLGVFFSGERKPPRQ